MQVFPNESFPPAGMDISSACRGEMIYYLIL